MKKNLLLRGLIIASMVIVLDQYSKIKILEVFSFDSSPVVITSFFNLILVWNHGVTFGMFNNPDLNPAWIFISLALVIIGFLVKWLWSSKKLIESIALSFIIGGAIGNIIDRVRWGAVVDFIDIHWGVYHWYTFNIADSAVVVGVVLLVYDGFVMNRKGGQNEG